MIIRSLPIQINITCFICNLDNVMSLEVHTSPTETKVGKWTLAMRIGVPTASGYLRKNKTTVCNITDKIIVVFNPWCKGITFFYCNTLKY